MSPLTAPRYFNPRSREGSDCQGFLQLPLLLQFQSTLPRGERQCGHRLHVDILLFQSTLPRGERRFRLHTGTDTSSDFNPRSREGSDASAPCAASSAQDFNPRSREGSDSTRMSPWTSRCYFNPRSREGSDECGCVVRVVCDISIHAPARGATQGCLFLPFEGGFQSTLPRGERHAGQDVHGAVHQFQSTLPRGERPLMIPWLLLLNGNFNPRSREGSDCSPCRRTLPSHTFQSTLPRGERHSPSHSSIVL